MASEKKMRQVREAYESSKGTKGITISKICKQSGVHVAEYVEWLTAQTNPKLIPFEVVEQTSDQTQSEISVKADFVLPNGMSVSHGSITLTELKNLVDKLPALC